MTPENDLQDEVLDLCDTYINRKLEEHIAQQRSSNARQQLLAKLKTVTAKEQGKA